MGGRSYFEQIGETEKAKKEYYSVLEIDPENVESLKMLGILLVLSSRYEDAINTLLRALRVGPADPVIHYHLGYSYSLIHDEKKALYHYEEYLRLEPEGEYSEIIKIFIGNLKN